MDGIAICDFNDFSSECISKNGEGQEYYKFRYKYQVLKCLCNPHVAEVDLKSYGNLRLMILLHFPTLALLL